MPHGSVLAAPVAALLLAAPCVAQPPAVSEEFLDSLKRVQRREAEANATQPAAEVMDAIGGRPGTVIGEVGAGRGRYTGQLARRVGPDGKVFANDIDGRALAFLRDRCVAERPANIETMLGKMEDPLLPKGSLDRVVMVCAYHALESPVPLLGNTGPSLKPGARLVVLDPVPEEVESESRGIARRHTVPTRGDVARGARLAGFEPADSKIGFLEKDDIFILRRRQTAFASSSAMGTGGAAGAATPAPPAPFPRSSPGAPPRRPSRPPASP